MAAKLQTEYQLTKAGFPKMICDQLAKLVNSKSEQIPPAYMCREEILVVIVYEKMTKDLKEYINSLDTNKTKNICYISLTGDGLDELAGISQQKGVKVAGKISLNAKKSLFGGVKMLPDDVTKAINAVKPVINGLFSSLKL